MAELDKRLRSFPRKLPIIREAEATNSIYFMVKGRAAVIVDGREVHEIGPGEFFGEIAGILRIRRTATVIAREYCEVYEFNGMGDGALYDFLRERPPKVLEALLRGLASKLIDSSRAQAKLIRDQEREINRLSKALSGALAVAEGASRKVARNEVLDELIHYMKNTSGFRRGDARNIEAKYLVNLRDVLFPKK